MEKCNLNSKFYSVIFANRRVRGFGDIDYALSFVEAKDISIKSSKNEEKIIIPTKTRSTVFDTPNKTHTVRMGDTLWSIAKTYLGSGMNSYVIYQKNKAVIEETARKHRRSSSENGRWIYPGTILLIP